MQRFTFVLCVLLIVSVEGCEMGVWRAGQVLAVQTYTAHTHSPHRVMKVHSLHVWQHAAPLRLEQPGLHVVPTPLTPHNPNPNRFLPTVFTARSGRGGAGQGLEVCDEARGVRGAMQQENEVGATRALVGVKKGVVGFGKGTAPLQGRRV